MVRGQVVALRLALALGLALLLGGCKGSSGGGQSTPPTPPAPRSAPVEFCYFGMLPRRDGTSDIAETADHVTTIWLMDWDDWNSAAGRERIAQRIIADLREAKALGINRAVVACGWCMFTNELGYISNVELQRFRQTLSDLGLLGMVKAISLVDEPDMQGGGISDATMTIAFRDAKAAWPEAKLAVIYGDHGTPGIAAADLIGHDDYPAGSGVLARLPGLQGAQQWILVPGGCDPWRNDPGPFYDFALAHREVWGICAFRWFDHPSGAGIRSNGMADAYRAVGTKIKGAWKA